VLLHARALLASSPQGVTAYLDADLRDTGTIMEQAASVLDFGQPVAVMLLGILHFIPDEDDPAAIVARLMAAVPPGSYLAIAHTASDITVGQTAEVCRLFAGLDLVEPGVVQVHRWRAGAGDLGTGRELANYGGVGRKP
jgi:hypothetical protein